MRAKIAKRGAPALTASSGCLRRRRVDEWWHRLVVLEAIGDITPSDHKKLERLTELRRQMDGPTETRHQRLVAWRDVQNLKALRRLTRSASDNVKVCREACEDRAYTQST